MRVFLTTTFTPAMLPAGYSGRVRFREVDAETFGRELSHAFRTKELVFAVGHENTAEMLRRKFLLSQSPYGRVRVELQRGDAVLAAIPQFRPPQAREFTDAEVQNASFRYWVISIGI